MRKWLILLFWSITLSAQIEEPVKWESSIESIKKNIFVLTFKAQIAPKWHLYSQFSDPNGAIPTEFIFKENIGFRKIGPTQESQSLVNYDKFFEMDLTYFNNEAVFQQKILIYLIVYEEHLQAFYFLHQFQSCVRMILTFLVLYLTHRCLLFFLCYFLNPFLN